MMTSLAPVLVTPPAAPCVSLAEAKAHLRVDHDDEDVLISGLIAAATAHFDGWGGVLGRCLATQVWSQAYPGFPICRRLVLPLAPVASVVVKYYDAENDIQTLSPSLYSFAVEKIGPCVVFEADGLPAVYDRRDSLAVEMTAGYGGTEDVPAAIRAALLMIVGDIYRNREASIAANLSANPVLDRLIQPYRRMVF